MAKHQTIITTLTKELARYKKCRPNSVQLALRQYTVVQEIGTGFHLSSIQETYKINLGLCLGSVLVKKTCFEVSWNVGRIDYISTKLADHEIRPATKADVMVVFANKRLIILSGWSTETFQRKIIHHLAKIHLKIRNYWIYYKKIIWPNCLI